MRAVCSSAQSLSDYAFKICNGPNDQMRIIACERPKSAFYYAKNVDKCPREDTREAACEDPGWAYRYAKDVDKEFRMDTWLAVKDSKHKEKYEKFFNRIMKEEII